jgi:hypothetical protein
LSKELKNKCLTQELELNQIVQFGVSLETVEMQLKSLHRSKDGPSEIVNQVDRANRKTLIRKECFQCGKPYFIGHREKCIAFKHKYHVCKKIGHLENKCYSRKRSSYRSWSGEPEHKKTKHNQSCNAVSNEENPDEAEEEIFYVDGNSTMLLKIGGVDVNFMIDSGSAANLIDEETWKKLLRARIELQNVPMNQVHKVFMAYASHTPLKIIAAFKTFIASKTNKMKSIFYVIHYKKKSGKFSPLQGGN